MTNRKNPIKDATGSNVSLLAGRGRRRLFAMRTISLILCILMLAGIAASCSRKNKNNSAKEGYIFSGDAYKSDAVTDLPPELSEVKISADGSNSSIIPVNSVFRVETAGKTDAATLTQYLSVNPEIPFAVQKRSDTEFLLSPLGSGLDEGRLYSFTLGDPANPAISYVFQTENELRVKSVLPADKAVGVPINTGIEIAFTQTVRNADFVKYIEISPKTEGRFEVYPDGKTVVFVPKNDLSVNTVYTVEVKKGIDSSSDKVLGEDYIAKFRTGTDKQSNNNYNELSIYHNNGELVFSPSEYPQVSFWVYNILSQSVSFNDVKVSLYKYANAKDAAGAIKEYEAVRGDYVNSNKPYVFPTRGLSKTGEYNAAVEGDGNRYSQNKYFSLPRLDKGIYLACYTISGSWGGKSFSFDYQIMLQISELRLRTESYNGKTLLWVARTTGTVAAGADIEADFYEREPYWSAEGGKAAFDNLKGKTGSDGVLILENSAANAGIICVSSGEDELVVTMLTDTLRERSYYTKYIFTDREVYFADDTVNFRGLISPFGDAFLPGRLYLYVGSVPYGSVAVNPDGSFEGSLPIESYTGWGMYLSFRDASGNDVASKYIRVTQSEKPVYRAAITFDKLFYEFGDTITATLKATFYDGSPASGLTFRYDTGNPFAVNGSAVTDAAGEAKVTIKTGPTTYVSGTRPIGIYITAELIGYETSSLRAYAYVYYFHSSHQFLFSRVNGEYSEVYLYHTDTSKIKSAADFNYPAFPNNIDGAAAAGRANILLRKIEYKKRKISTEYDPITKTTYPVYDYYTVENNIRSYTEEFRDGKIRLDHIDTQGEENVYYYYNVSFYDEQNRVRYAHDIYANKQDGVEVSPYNWYNRRIETDKSTYSVGDNVSVTFKDDGTTVPGSILYTVYDTNGLSAYYVTTGGASFRYTDAMVLSGRVYAAAQSGSKRLSAEVSLVYDYTANNNLDVEISSDSASYKPGQRAVVNVRVRDGNGAPATGNVTLAVVDEACFALGEQYVNALERYFTSVGSGRYYPYYDYGYYREYQYGFFYGYGSVLFNVTIDSSFDIFREIASGITGTYSGGNAAAETGAVSREDSKAAADSAAPSESASGSGAAETYIRRYFADNPVFSTAALGKDGVATFSFNVPDNLTEWRLTAVAASGLQSRLVSEHKLGTATSGMIVTQPFFVNVSACEYYIAGDDITVSARAYGTLLAERAEVSYTAEITADDGRTQKPVSVTGRAGEHSWFNFGKLPSGRYSITVKAASGVQSDGVKLNFSVIDSANMVYVRRSIGIDEIKSLKPLAYPLSLSFSSAAYEKYYTVSGLVYRNYTTVRSDARAAYYVISEAESVLFGDGSLPVNSGGIYGSMNRLTMADGLISLLEYSGGDLELTAKICAIAPGMLGASEKDIIINTLYGIADGKTKATETELTAALLGLSALGEPVLDRLHYIASICRDYPAEAKLYLAAALAYIGDFPAANEFYGILKSEYAQSGEGGELYFKGSNTEDSIKRTALALLTAARINRTDAGGMVNYLADRVSSSEYYGLEMSSYIRFFMPGEKTTAAFSYRFGNDGETVSITLTAGEIYNLQLTKSGFDNLQILSHDDGIRVRAAYGGSPADAIDGADVSKEITVTKNITSYDERLGLYRVDIRFSGKSDRAYASFEISDVIPSGARYVSSIYDYGDSYISGDRYIGAWIYNPGGQRMNGHIWISNRSSTFKWHDVTSEYTFNGTVSYIIRGAVTGEFIAEQTLVRNTRTGAYALGNRLSVTIADTGWVVRGIK